MWWRMDGQEETFPLLESMCEDDGKLSAPKGFIWLLRCIRNSERIVKNEPLFLVPRLSLDEGHRALSPNGRYYYHSDFIASPDNPDDYAATTLFWERGQSMPHKLPISSLFYAVFSPDSRFLCGFAKDGAYRAGVGSFYVVECATRKARLLFRLRSPQDFTYKWGWYPDSRHIWYALGKSYEEEKVTIYKCDISSGTQAAAARRSARGSVQGLGPSRPTLSLQIVNGKCAGFCIRTQPSNTSSCGADTRVGRGKAGRSSKCTLRGEVGNHAD